MSAMQIMEVVSSTHFVSILPAPIIVVNASLDMLATKGKGAQIVLESVLMGLFVMKTPNVWNPKGLLITSVSAKLDGLVMASTADQTKISTTGQTEMFLALMPPIELLREISDVKWTIVRTHLILGKKMLTGMELVMPVTTTPITMEYLIRQIIVLLLQIQIKYVSRIEYDILTIKTDIQKTCSNFVWKSFCHHSQILKLMVTTNEETHVIIAPCCQIWIKKTLTEMVWETIAIPTWTMMEFWMKWITVLKHQTQIKKMRMAIGMWQHFPNKNEYQDFKMISSN